MLQTDRDRRDRTSDNMNEKCVQKQQKRDDGWEDSDWLNSTQLFQYQRLREVDIVTAALTSSGSNLNSDLNKTKLPF